VAPQSIPNEVAQLSQVYQHMAARIQLQIGQLRDNDSQRRELLAQLSHDLRTPLAALQGYLETLEMKVGQLSEADQTRFVQTALRNALLLKSLVDQIFELAHLESGQVTVDTETFPLAELLHDISAKFALRAKAQEVELLLPNPVRQIEVTTDIGKLERVLSNLIDNALRHTPSGGSVTIHIENIEQQRLAIHVKDTGCGIPEGDIPYIFEARYRASNATGEKHQHGGFGLAICQGLLGLLHSELHVESAENSGSDFWFELSL
jgi:signal transduction histidine kinase